MRDSSRFLFPLMIAMIVSGCGGSATTSSSTPTSTTGAASTAVTSATTPTPAATPTPSAATTTVEVHLGAAAARAPHASASLNFRILDGNNVKVFDFSRSFTPDVTLTAVPVSGQQLYIDFMSAPDGNLPGLLLGQSVVPLILAANVPTQVTNPPVDVTIGKIVSLQVVLAAPTVAVGADTKLMAIGTTADKQQVDVTPLVRWTSSSPSVATILTVTGQNFGKPAADGVVITIVGQNFGHGVAVGTTTLTAKLPAQQSVITGAGAGGGPHVKVFNGTSVQSSFFAFASSFSGGVRVAAADVDGDGLADIIGAAGPGGGPHVKVFSGTLDALASFFAFDAGFLGGVFVASAEKSGIVVGAGPGGGPQVKVLDAKSQTSLASFFAYDAGFSGGVRVAAGDVNGDGVPDIICGAGPGGGPHVKVFDGKSFAEIMSFFAFEPTFVGGIYVAAGDIDGDGRADIVVGADAGGGPRVSVFNGATGKQIITFDALESSFTGGVRVAAGDVNGDGFADVIVGAGAGGGPQVTVYDGFKIADNESPRPQDRLSVISSFFAYEPGFVGGVFVASGRFQPQVTATIPLTVTATPSPSPAGRLYVSNGSNSSVASFAAPFTASGNVAPTTQVSNPALQGVEHIAVDPARNILYVACSTNNSIAIYDNASTVTGNTVPSRVISGGNTSLSLPVGLFVDSTSDTLFIGNSRGQSICIFSGASTATGNIAPGRMISAIGQSVRALTVGGNRIFASTTAALGPSISVWDAAATVTGAVAPTRSFSDAGLVSPQGVFLTSSGTLWVADAGSALAPGAVASYASAATLSGPVVAQQRLTGVATGLMQPIGLFIDPLHDELYVTDGTNMTVDVFASASTSTGNQAFIRQLGGAATGLSQPSGIFLDVTH